MKLLKKIVSYYKIDEVPLLLKPLLYLYGYSVGIIYWSYFQIVFLTSRIKWENKERLAERHIIAFWHQHSVIFFSCFQNLKNYSALFHPYWYMYPNFIHNRLLGTKLIAGSTGNSGKEASLRVVEDLKRGYSTFITPDGPQGPQRKLKKGVLYLASLSQTPVVALGFKASFFLRLPTWDKKELPLPFGKITVFVSPSVSVSDSTFDESGRKISDLLNSYE